MTKLAMGEKNRICSTQTESEQDQLILEAIETCLRLGTKLTQEKQFTTAIYLYQLILEKQPNHPQISQALEAAFQQKPITEYENWNRALAEYFTEGFTAGDTIYLSVDEMVLAEIGIRLEGDIEHLNWTERFIQVVSDQCIKESVVDLNSIYGHDRRGIPNCVALLSICVLAAYQMRSEELDRQESVATHNYFTRLRQVLKLSDQSGGRPSGFKTGQEKEAMNWLTD